MSISTKRFKTGLYLASALVLAGGISGCSVFSQTTSIFSQSEKDQTENWSANKLYTTAKEALNAGDYERAIKL